MDAKSVVLFVISIASFAAINSEGNRKLADSFVGSGAINNFHGINATTVERAWNYSKKEGITEGVKDSRFSRTKISISQGIVHVGGKESFSKSMYPVLVIPRRYLKRNVHAPSPGPASPQPSAETPGIQVLAPSPYLSPISSPSWPPSSSPSPSVSPGPSPSPLTSPSPTPGVESPSEAPELNSTDSPDSNPDMPPARSVASPPPPPHRRPSPPPRHHPSPIPHVVVSENRFVTASVVASAVAGVILLALLLIICTKKRTSEPTNGQTDGKPNPLLSFNSGDFYEDEAPGMSKDFKASSAAVTSLRSAKHSHLANSQTSGVDGNGEQMAPMMPRLEATAPPPPPGAPPPPKPPAPAPPPLPKGRPPPNPLNPKKPTPPVPHHRQPSAGEASMGDDSGVQKAKLKPFFWDKVLANPDHSMVWHEIKSGSFQFNEEMMESLFGYVPADKMKNEHKKDSSSADSPARLLRIIDPKKSQNLAILLKALNVTTKEVCDALEEGNQLPAELIQTLLKMAPTPDEELKLRLYDGDVSHLGSAERFLRVLVNIPYAFKRLEALLFVSTFQEEFPSIKESFSTLEVACNELRNSRLFLKLLEAVLKTGNRMNVGTYRGGAHAFKLDTLLKLSDVKGTDGKTTLLHFVVNETIRSEGIRSHRRLKESHSPSSLMTAEHVGEESPSHSHEESDEYHRELGLQVVSGLSDELRSVKKAAIIDNENLSETISKLRQSLNKTKEFIENEMKSIQGESDFRDGVASFIADCESDMEWLREEERRIMEVVKSTGDYFHGKAGREEGLHLFPIVRDFLLMVDKACQDMQKAPASAQRREAASPAAAALPSKLPPDINRRLFPAMLPHDAQDIGFSSEDDDDDD